MSRWKNEDEPENDRQMRNKMFIFLDNILSFHFFSPPSLRGIHASVSRRKKQPFGSSATCFKCLNSKVQKSQTIKFDHFHSHFESARDGSRQQTATKMQNDYGRWKIIIRFQQAKRQTKRSDEENFSFVPSSRMRPTSGWLCRCHHLSKLYWQLVRNNEISFVWHTLSSQYGKWCARVCVEGKWILLQKLFLSLPFDVATIVTTFLMRYAANFPRLSKSHIFPFCAIATNESLCASHFRFISRLFKFQLPLNVIAIANQILNCPFYWYFRFDWMNCEILLNKCHNLLRFNVIWLLSVWI